MLILAGPRPAPGHRQAGHPERPDRITAVMAGLRRLDLGSSLQAIEPVLPTTEALQRVHDPHYLGDLATACRAGASGLDPDTYLTRGSWDAALESAGAGLAALDALRRAGAGLALVATRPPGHHATRRTGMGFCLLNNIAVIAAALAAAGERVLIVDWDVHHGNGTQDIFWDDPAVLYTSLHQWPLYPGTGRPEEIGGPRARGTTLNVPLPPGATGDIAVQALDELVVPVATSFAPTWVLVSAGFDAHRNDPLANLCWSAGDFARLARGVAELAPGPGRLILFVEGGYDLGALEASTAATIGELLEVPAATDPSTEAPTSGGPGREAVRALSDAWPRRIEGLAGLDATITSESGSASESGSESEWRWRAAGHRRPPSPR